MSKQQSIYVSSRYGTLWYNPSKLGKHILDEHFVKKPDKSCFNLSPYDLHKVIETTVLSGTLIARERGEAEDTRGQWGNPIEFMMTMISFAVGLGNVWRFPYLAYSNGGGAFLIPYVIMLVLVGMPLYLMESSLGQYTGLGPTKIWSSSPLFKGIGWASLLICWLIATYYNVIVSYCGFYLIKSMTSNLPWANCANGFGDWADSSCRNVVKENLTNINTTLAKYCVNGTVVGPKSPSDEFYYNYVAGMSTGIEETGVIQWRLLISFICCWIIVGGVLIKGAESLGKVVYVTAIFPYIMLTILLINNCLQPGATDGIIFYLKPDFDKLMNIQVWAAAASQIFFSLSACYGGLVVMSSYNQFHHKILRDSVIICIVNCSTSIYAGFSIFSALGTIAHARGVNVSEVATKGPELAFVVYPQALSTMPIAPLWSILFYIMMVLLGFGSEFSTVEAVIASLMDQFPNLLRKDRRRAMTTRISMFILCFIIGLPMITQGGLYLFNLVDNAIGVPLLVIGLFETVAISWVYGIRNFRDNVKEMVGYAPNYYWLGTWAGITPVLLMGLVGLQLYSTYNSPLEYVGFIYDSDCPYKYPWWGQLLYWVIVLSPFIIIGIGFIHQIFKFTQKYGFSMQTLYLASKPSADWKPQRSAGEKEKPENDDVYFTETPIEWGQSKNDGILADHKDEMVHPKSFTKLEYTNQAYIPDNPEN